MSKTQFFIVCFILTILSLSIGFIAGFHYQEPAKASASGQRYSSATAYTLGLADTMPFGKHKGKLVRDVLAEAPDYLRWMRENVQRVTFTDTVLQLLEN